MNKRDIYGIAGGIVFALVWYLITRYPLQAVSTGVIFTLAWFAGSRLSIGRRQRQSGKK